MRFVADCVSRPSPRHRGSGDARFLAGVAILAAGVLLIGVLAPPTPEIALENARELRKAGDLTAARSAFEALIDRESVGARASLDLATLDVEAGNLESAEATLRRAIDQFPDDSEVWEAFAGILLATKRGPEAAEAFQKAIEKDETNDSAASFLGQMLEDGGNLALARIEYEKARRANPNKALYILLEARLLWKMYQPNLTKTLLAQLDERRLILDDAEKKLRIALEEDLEIFPNGPPPPMPPEPGSGSPDDH